MVKNVCVTIIVFFPIDSILLILLWGVCHSTSCYVSKNYRSHTIRRSFNRELSCLEEYITIYCNLLINMVKKMHLNSCSNYFFPDMTQFCYFYFGGGGMLLKKMFSCVSHKNSNHTIHHSMNGQMNFLKNTSRYFVIY